MDYRVRADLTRSQPGISAALDHSLFIWAFRLAIIAAIKRGGI